jgi:hypothetical protein
VSLVGGRDHRRKENDNMTTTYQNGDLVQYLNRTFRVGRVFSDGDLKLERYEEPVGYDDVIVFSENVTKTLSAPPTWLHRREYAGKWWGYVSAHSKREEAPPENEPPKDCGANGR